ncbi:hypothetical protein [Microtetraspora glauca]|uniref:Uncharacterized protein n=1 Tax=Microtetraspora glauca TaxID=1996 RepID=A0ABV3GAQ2_MICGL
MTRQPPQRKTKEVRGWSVEISCDGEIWERDYTMATYETRRGIRSRDDHQAVATEMLHQIARCSPHHWWRMKYTVTDSRDPVLRVAGVEVYEPPPGRRPCDCIR